MKLTGFEFRGHKCFKTEWSGIKYLTNVNLIVGPNNSGKSQLLDMTKALLQSDNSFPGLGIPLTCFCNIGFDELAESANESNLRNGLEADQQDQFKRNGINVSFTWNVGTLPQTYMVEKCSFLGNRQSSIEEIIKDFVKMSPPIHTRIEHDILERPLRSISAARNFIPEDIRNEDSEAEMVGIVNNLYYQEHGSDQARFQKLKRMFLDATNYVLQEESPFIGLTFKNIRTKRTLSLESEFSEEWDVMSMGAGVREIVSIIYEVTFSDDKVVNRKQSTLFIEEPENNLHPAAQRRLARFLHRHALEKNEFLFISTHSSTILSEFISLGNCGVTRVEKNSETSLTTSVNTSSILDLHQTTSALGSTPGDLFMANGIIWVEGPSDRIYISNWINLFRQNSGLSPCLEGHHYTFAFLGGVNATHHSVSLDGSDEFGRLIVYRVNSRFFFILDSDRRDNEAVKKHVARLKEECVASKIHPTPIWITDDKEIENYLPIEAWERAFPNHKGRSTQDPRGCNIWDSRAKGGWLAEFLGQDRLPSKVSVAEALCAETTWELMSENIQWRRKMEDLMESIDKWNR